MSLVFLAISIFLLDRIRQTAFSKGKRQFLSKQTTDKLKWFTIIADLLLFSALCVKYILSSVEPFLLYFVINTEDILTSDALTLARGALQFISTLETPPLEFAFITFILLAYFAAMIAPGVLIVCSYCSEELSQTPYRDILQSGVEKPPEIYPKEKLYLKLCHLRN